MHEIHPTPEEYEQLYQMRDRDPKPYMRERAAAILKVAAHIPAAVVAREGLLRKRKADTVYRWIRSFEQGSVEGLQARPGRGRKPAFSPSLPE